MSAQESALAIEPPSNWVLKNGVVIVLMLRTLLIGTLIFVFNDVTELGTSPLLISVAGAIGVIVAAQLGKSPLKSWAALVLTIAIAGAYFIGSSILVSLWAGVSGSPLWAYSLSQHVDLLVSAALICFVSTWLFLRFEATVTCEALLLGFLGVSLLSGHRNFHFEMPKAVNDFAWQLGIGNLAALVLIGLLLSLLLLAYLQLAAIPWPEYRRDKSIVTGLSPYRLRAASLIAILLIVSALVYGVGVGIHAHYRAEALSRTANGVGQDSKEGLSPLGFHSAIGSTNQPAALVRLEGDYSQNPFSPMLYMREMALSEFNGHELVQAGPSFDSDVSHTKPEEAYTGEADVDLLERTPVNQSIFLLADHQQAFAVDYPLSLIRLKNPNPSRFKASYRAYSMAPAFPLGSIEGLGVGDPRWDEKTKAHYLQVHQDKRYSDLAQKLTTGITNPVAKANAITGYLTKTAIYTLTPNHEVKDGEDPVAPFLFGDHRGYCVHFAHAIVYMLRSLGVPSRIGTGYLTDLSQAKDGHILLRMADRHAWAEVYITGRGWVPFDIQPEQVENHGDLQVDMKLLEELMGMIDPGEEILPKENLKGESNLEAPSSWQAPDAQMVFSILTVLAACIILCKVLLRWGWLVMTSPKLRLKYSYISISSLLEDLGHPRNFGETRREFGERLQAAPKLSPRALGRLITEHYYAASPEPLTASKVNRARNEDLSAIRNIHAWKRIVAFLNPTSILSLLRGGRW